MTRREYTDQVLAALRNVTAEERTAIREEIDAHLEDHICALLDLGYDPELAEQRTMAAMGDPEEVGKELDKQYPLHWLVLGRAALAVTAVMCLVLLIGLPLLGNLTDSLKARLAPPVITSDYLAMKTTEERDLRAAVGDDVLRVCRVSVGVRDGQRMAEVALCAYDRVPGGIVSEELLAQVRLENQRGEAAEFWWAGAGGSSLCVTYANRYVPVEPGDTDVTLVYDRFGEAMSLQIPLPEEVAP